MTVVEGRTRRARTMAWPIPRVVPVTSQCIFGNGRWSPFVVLAVVQTARVTSSSMLVANEHFWAHRVQWWSLGKLPGIQEPAP
ncbi:hypothetical protein HYQ44_008357 [Verticillium longisporum]|nr:hypothetical protein HYQ44_008357 [Verticillium longisporum]